MKIKIYSIAKIRIGTDGTGVRSLIAVVGCPLNCKYCLNKIHTIPDKSVQELTIDELYDKISIYKLYYDYTNGGLTYGGGEPLQYYEFIIDFYNKYHISTVIETSLNFNISKDKLIKLAEISSQLIIDIKDINNTIYSKYTNKDNSLVLNNLNLLNKYNHKIKIRVPHIPNYNTPQDIKNTINKLHNMGYNNIDEFNYIINRNCSKCNYTLGLGLNYCPRCGQKINYFE